MTDQMTPTWPEVTELTRADQIGSTLDNAALDGSVMVISGPGTSDLLVDGWTLRGLEAVIADWAARRSMSTIVYSEAGGARSIDAPDGPRCRVPSGIDVGTPVSVAMDVLFEGAQQSSPQCLVLQFSEGILPAAHGGLFAGDTARIIEQIASRAVDPAWRAAGHRIVMVGRTGEIDDRLTRLPGITRVVLGLPRLAERITALELMERSPRHSLILDSALDLPNAARLLGGISLDGASRLRYRSSARSPLGLEEIIEAKKVSIRQMAGDTLVVLDDVPNLDTDVAGLSQVRRYLAEEIDRGNVSLRAVLTGPPGNGKSYVAGAIAGALGTPAIMFGRIEGRWVGESQDNLRRAFDALEANAPVTVILDEIDQSVLSRRGAHSGDGANVKADLRAMMFEWLGDVGDQRGISVIGLSNRPDLLDEASADRFAMIPILHPDPDEAAEIMAIQARRAGLDIDTEAAALALMASGDSYSGRQLIRLLGSADVHARENGRACIGGSDVTWAIGDFMERIGPGEERQALLAIRATTFQRLLPWNAARAAGDANARPPAYLELYVRDDGSIDVAELDRRIGELDDPRGY
jgi:AAA+ superfamily predicted ATPase